MAGNISLDPTKWAEPKESLIGRIVKCEYSDTDQAKSRDGETFTEMRGWPRAGQTWVVEVERLDAVYVNSETGEKSPIKRYLSVDLERYDEKATPPQMKPVTQGNNKAQFLLGKWNDKLKLAPDPTKNVGAVCEFELLRSKNFGGPQPAKNLLYPLKVLARPDQGADFVFHGEVQEISFDPSRNEGESLEDAAASQETEKPKAKSEQMDEEAVFNALVGIDPEDEDALTKFVTSNKANIPSAIKTALIAGDFIQAAIEAGSLKVEDGKLSR